MSDLELQGVRELERALDKAGDKANKALAAAMFEEGNRIMTRSKMITPVDIGTLRNSGTVLRPEMRGNQIEVQMGFGGAASAYAEIQHERTDYHHTVGEAKFLKKPLDAAKQGLAQRLAKRVNAAIRRI